MSAPQLEPVAFDAMAEFARDDLAAALDCFRLTAERIVAGAREQRVAVPPHPALVDAARASFATDDAAAFFRQWFRPHRIKVPGFVTAYYEVAVDARLTPEPGFETPALSRPPDLVTLGGEPLRSPAGELLTSARRRPDGGLEPYPRREEIEEGAATGAEPIAYVRDAVELFLIQVQGSARLRMPGGETIALTYDGRNGWPYSSIGREMVARGVIAGEDMTLDRMKETLRGMGLGEGAPGRKLMRINKSYVFFRIDDSEPRRIGPIGGAGAPLTPMRSIAIDRSIWSYGLPFWIETRLPWESDAETPFCRLMIGQDTGSAILGPARADLYFGSGETAGRRAGQVRHPAEVIVLMPTGAAP